MNGNMKATVMGIAAAWMAALAAPAQAGADMLDRETLLGGNRAAMAKAGYTFEAVYTGEYFINNGGLKNGDGYLDNKDVTLEIDGETALGWHGATLFFYALGNEGADPSSFVGDAQATSNIETGSTTWKLYEAWIDQRLGDRFRILAGLYDLNGEFDVTETAGLFLLSSHGIGPDFSQSGRNGPSIFPTTSLALRIAARVAEAGYVQAAMLDGVPGDPTNGRGTQVEIHGKDGWLIALEAGHVRGLDEGDDAPFHKLSLGAWYYTAKFPHNDGVSPDEHNWGVYGIADRAFGDRLSAFLRLGMANDAVNQFGTYVGTGAVLTGLFGEDDQLGLGVAHAVNGGAFADANPGFHDAETNLELSYRTQLTGWLAVQPDIQFVSSPSTDPAVDEATIVSVRFEAAL